MKGLKIQIHFLFIFFLLLFSFHSLAKKNNVHTIKIALYAEGGGHHVSVTQALALFEKQNPNIKLQLMLYRGVEKYNKNVATWLAEQEGPDIIFWYGGSRIKPFVEKYQIHNLSNIWNKYNLDSAFHSSIVNSAKVNHKAYGIPISAFLWTFYYNVELFEKFQLNVPQNWGELISSCKALRENNIDLFSIGIKDSAWTTHGWFDYFNLRLNGIEFYRELLAGNIPYTDEKVKDVFVHWKQLIDNKCFNDNYNDMTTWEAFPRIMRGYSVMTLNDGIPKNLEGNARYNVDITPFTPIKEQLPLYTVQPVNIFIVPAYTHLNTKLEKLLLFLSQAEFQTAYNLPIKRVPPNKTSLTASTKLADKVTQLVNLSPGSVQYFDRETHINFANHTPKIFTDFMNAPDIDKTLLQLEALRKKVFQNKNIQPIN